MRKILILMILIIALVGCATTSQEAVQEEVKIGVLVPLTGPIPHYSEDMREAYELAVEGQQIKL